MTLAHDNIEIIIMTDVDECATNNGGCEDSCTNTEGSYFCSCDPGFKLDDDGHSCNGKHSFLSYGIWFGYLM